MRRFRREGAMEATGAAAPVPSQPARDFRDSHRPDGHRLPYAAPLRPARPDRAHRQLSLHRARRPFRDLRRPDQHVDDEYHRRPLTVTFAIYDAPRQGHNLSSQKLAYTDTFVLPAGSTTKTYDIEALIDAGLLKLTGPNQFQADFFIGSTAPDQIHDETNLDGIIVGELFEYDGPKKP